MNPLNAYLAFEIMSDRVERAERHRAARAARPRREMRRYDAVTIRRATPDDRATLERLAQLEGSPAPGGSPLVAEVDRRVLAARWIGCDFTLADPFMPTAELVSLLETRARHLGARPRLIAHPLRRAAWSLHRGQRRAERYS
jgi:hypothetical protein